MMIAMAIAVALLAVLAGVLLAALEQPRADTDRRTRQLSLVLVVGTSVTAAAGVAYALVA
jgi:hypothetical protein